MNTLRLLLTTLLLAIAIHAASGQPGTDKRTVSNRLYTVSIPADWIPFHPVRAMASPPTSAPPGRSRESESSPSIGIPRLTETHPQTGMTSWCRASAGKTGKTSPCQKWPD